MSSPFDHAGSFGKGAAAYAANRPTYPDALFRWIAEVAPARRLAVDVASGGGQGARGLLPHFERVVATDQSPELLATIPPAPNLTTLAQSADALDLGERADVLTVFQALHWFSGEVFWERVRANLASRGVFVVVGYAWFSVDTVFDRVFHGRVLPVLEPAWSPNNQLLLNGYRDVQIPFAAVPSAAFSIELDWTLEQLVAYVSTWSAVTKIIAATGVNPIEGLIPALQAAWGSAPVRRVRMPLAVRAFRMAAD